MEGSDILVRQCHLRKPPSTDSARSSQKPVDTKASALKKRIPAADPTNYRSVRDAGASVAALIGRHEAKWNLVLAEWFCFAGQHQSAGPSMLGQCIRGPVEDVLDVRT